MNPFRDNQTRVTPENPFGIIGELQQPSPEEFKIVFDPLLRRLEQPTPDVGFAFNQGTWFLARVTQELEVQGKSAERFVKIFERADLLNDNSDPRAEAIVRLTGKLPAALTDEKRTFTHAPLLSIARATTFQVKSHWCENVLEGGASGQTTIADVAQDAKRYAAVAELLRRATGLEQEPSTARIAFQILHEAGLGIAADEAMVQWVRQDLTPRRVSEARKCWARPRSPTI